MSKPRVMFLEPVDWALGECSVLVSMSYDSAVIEAKRLYNWHARRKPMPPAVEEEYLDDWMAMNWAWFDGG